MRIRLSYKDRYLLLQALSPFETRSFPSLPRCFPRSFTFYVAHPVRSIPAFPRRKRLRLTRLRSWSSEGPAIRHVSGTLLRGAGAARRRHSRHGRIGWKRRGCWSVAKRLWADDDGLLAPGPNFKTLTSTLSVSFDSHRLDW